MPRNESGQFPRSETIAYIIKGDPDAIRKLKNLGADLTALGIPKDMQGEPVDEIPSQDAKLLITSLERAIASIQEFLDQPRVAGCEAQYKSIENFIGHFERLAKMASNHSKNDIINTNRLLETFHTYQDQLWQLMDSIEKQAVLNQGKVGFWSKLRGVFG